MQYRHVGQSGLKVSAISLGGWLTFGNAVQDKTIARDIITMAYDSGINFFDIADAYGRGQAETMMGEVLKAFPRHTLVISTKAYWPMSDDPNDQGLSRKHLMESIDKSLARIGTDYVDIYFCHRWDDETPLLETIRTMDDLIHRGKALYWGTSEWTAEQIQQAHDLAERYNLYPPIVEQPHYNMRVRARFEKEIAPAATKHGMGLVTWSPLSSGLLTGKYDEGIPDDTRLARVDWLRDMVTPENIEQVKKLEPIADDLGITRAQLAVAWCARHEAVSSVITGATDPAQLESNIKAAEVELSDDVLAAVDGIFGPDSYED